MATLEHRRILAKPLLHGGNEPTCLTVACSTTQVQTLHLDGHYSSGKYDCPHDHSRLQPHSRCTVLSHVDLARRIKRFRKHYLAWQCCGSYCRLTSSSSVGAVDTIAAGPEAPADAMVSLGSASTHGSPAGQSEGIMRYHMLHYRKLIVMQPIGPCGGHHMGRSMHADARKCHQP